MQLLLSVGSPVSTPRNHPTFYTLDVTHICLTLQPKLRYLGSEEGMTCLDKSRQTYMLAALKTKETCSKQNADKYNDIPQYKIGDLMMITNFEK